MPIVILLRSKRLQFAAMVRLRPRHSFCQVLCYRLRTPFSGLVKFKTSGETVRLEAV